MSSLCLSSLAFAALIVQGSMVRAGALPAQDLAKWDIWGVGDVSFRAELDAIELREGFDSEGVALVSPSLLPLLARVRLELKPLRHEGVVVLILVDGPVAEGVLEPPPGYRGEIDFWRQAVRGWAFGLHTGFHQPDAFIAELPSWEVRVSARDPAPDERWYRVEIARTSRVLWLDVDGKRVLKLPVPSNGAGGDGAGRLALRLRGDGDGTFACLVRRVEWNPATGDETSSLEPRPD